MLTRIINKLERTTRKSLYLVGVEEALYKRQGIKTIVMYHGLSKDSDTRFNGRFMPVGVFKAQLNYFKKKYESIPVKGIFKSRIKSKPQLAITFDDGYKNNFDLALPILEEMQIPATFYVTALNHFGIPCIWSDAVDIYSYFLKEFKFNNLSFIKVKDRKRLFCKEISQDLNQFTGFLPQADKLRLIKELETIAGFRLKDKKELGVFHELMSDAEIYQTAQSRYVTIGSHGAYHSHLGHIPTSEALSELEISKNYLEKCTQKAIDEIAYPSGSYSQSIVDEAYRLGFKYQLAVNYLSTTDQDNPFLLDRVGLYNDSSLTEQLHLVNSKASMG